MAAARRWRTRWLSALLVAVATCLAVPATGQSPPPRLLSWVEVIAGPPEATPRWPVAVAAAADGEVAVADAFESRVLRFRRIGVSWQFEGTTALPASPAGMTHDGTRFIVTLRQPGGMLALEGSEGRLRRLPLSEKTVPGPIVATREGTLLVFDAAALDVVEISSEGAELRRVKIGHPVTALASGNQGAFFAAVPQPAMVLTFAANGTLRSTWTLPGEGPVPAWPTGIAVEPGGDLLVTDRHGQRVLVFNATGRWIGIGSRGGREPGLVRWPSGIVRLPNGEYLVADQGNSRLQVFRRLDRTVGR